MCGRLSAVFVCRSDKFVNSEIRRVIRVEEF